MHTRISPDNPHGYNRYGFAWEQVPRGSLAHLDFGCHDGAFLSTLRSKGVKRLVGVDISKEALDKGSRFLPELELKKIEHAASLPFDNAQFDSITVLDVLEHVYEQRELLAELTRVLKTQGRIIVTVPGRHIFSCLDRGNLKFLLPRLHRWYYCRRHSRREYERRYVANPDGLIGDISARKRWHEHLRRRRLRRLLEEAGLDVIDIDGTGFFQRLITMVNLLLLRWFKPVQPLIRKLLVLDAKRFECTNLFCVAQKRS